MAKGSVHWEPEAVAKMSTKDIEAKMKALVPGFDLGEFARKAERYVSCEDMSDEEYYPHATFSDIDEDFIWMACEVLWRRLVPGRLAVEHLAEEFDNKMGEIAKAAEKEQLRKLVKLHQQAFALISPHIIEHMESGYRLRRQFYEKFCQTTLYDVDGFLDNLILSLLVNSKHARVQELTETLAEAFEDDSFLTGKALSLLTQGKGEESEKLFQELVERNPANPWFAIDAGDAFLRIGKPDYGKARDYYLKALEVAKVTSPLPEGREELEAVYGRLLDVAASMGDTAEVGRYQAQLDALKATPAASSTSGRKVGRNDPCPCGSGKKYKKCCGLNASQLQQTPPIDRRLMERDLLAVNQMVEGQDFGSIDDMNRYINDKLKGGSAPEWVPSTPLEKAQSLIFEALETSGKERHKLVKQALKVSPDCADAYVLLAEEKAQGLEEALSLYDAGVRAGERAVGEKIFQEEVGHFWGMVETRPYMRARAGLAQCLWQLGKHKQAIEHYRDMLRLNPNDNQGIRYILASCLLELDEINALKELLERYDEPTADWLYTGALVVFLRQGDSSEARERLLEALEHNRHVVLYLLGRKKLPGQLPERVGFGDESEAIAYAAEFGPGWIKAKDAINWLRFVCNNEQAIRQGQSVIDIPEAFTRAFESNDKTQQPAKRIAVEIYAFKVSLRESPSVWRKIEIKGSQTLHDLHKAIFEAYERYDEHLYAFFMSNKPWDSSSEYSIPHPESNARNAKRARIDSLALKPKKKFLYLFDFGDEWWHSVQLLDIRQAEPKRKYPCVIESQGEAPPQYADYDEDEA